MVKLQIGEEEEDTLIVVTAHLDAHSFDVRLSQLTQLMNEIVLKVADSFMHRFISTHAESVLPVAHRSLRRTLKPGFFWAATSTSTASGTEGRGRPPRRPCNP